MTDLTTLSPGPKRKQRGDESAASCGFTESTSSPNKRLCFTETQERVTIAASVNKSAAVGDGNRACTSGITGKILRARPNKSVNPILYDRIQAAALAAQAQRVERAAKLIRTSSKSSAEVATREMRSSNSLNPPSKSVTSGLRQTPRSSTRLRRLAENDVKELKIREHDHVVEPEKSVDANRESKGVSFVCKPTESMALASVPRHDPVVRVPASRSLQLDTPSKSTIEELCEGQPDENCSEFVPNEMSRNNRICERESKGDSNHVPNYVEKSVPASEYAFSTPRVRRASAKVFDTMFVSPPMMTPSPVLPKVPSILSTMKLFSIGGKEAQTFRKHLRSVSERSTQEFWSTTTSDIVSEAYQRTVAMKLTLRLLQCITEIICGADAATEFLKLFLSWVTSESTSKDDLLLTSARALTKTRKGSLESRSIRAVLCGTFSLKMLRALAIDVEGFSIGRRAYSAGCRDIDILLDEGALDVSRYSRQKFDARTVDDAIRHILSMENVAFLSWGTKTIKLDGEKIVAPAIQRRKTVKVMFDQYKNRDTLGSFVSRRTFYRVASVLTHGTTQPRTAVNYVTGFLINDTFELLRRIVCALIPETSTAVLRRLDILREWLKYSGGQVFENDSSCDDQSCPRHLIMFGLTKPDKTVADNEKVPNINKKFVSCRKCDAMDTISEDATQRVEATSPDSSTLNVLNDAYEKMKLYLGHRVRVSNQQRALQKMVDDIKSRCILDRESDRAIVVIDYKMKMEPLYYREKTVDHYGKRGMSWHGAMVRYWTYDNGSGGAKETKIYLDQISNADNKQDKEAVVAGVEGISLSIRRELPFIKRVIFQSDNASCYQNTFVTLVIPLIGSVHGIQVDRFVHSETQDGKCVLDAHFATAMRKIKNWVRQGHNCTTPREVVVALNAEGRLPNCLAELVEFDREKMKAVYAGVDLLAKSLSKHISRFNDVVFNHPASVQCSQQFDVQTWPPFSLRIFEYSGVGDGIYVSVSPSLGRCSYSNDEQECKCDDAGDESASTYPHQISNDDDLGAIMDELPLSDVNQSCLDSESDSEDEFDSFPAIDTESEEINDENRVPKQCIGIITGIRVTHYCGIRMREISTAHSRRIPPKKLQNSSYSERDIQSYAKRCLVDMQSGGDNGEILKSVELSSKLVAVACECMRGARNKTILDRGWARRPKKGFMYGAKYINHYKDEVDELFRRGEADSGNKLGPARMLEVLTRKYPHRFNLPGENEIRARISTLAQSRKAKPKCNQKAKLKINPGT